VVDALACGTQIRFISTNPQILPSYPTLVDALSLKAILSRSDDYSFLLNHKDNKPSDLLAVAVGPFDGKPLLDPSLGGFVRGAAPQGGEAKDRSQLTRDVVSITHASPPF